MRKITWDKFDELIKKLADKLSVEKFDFCYGIPRGGLFPVVMLSHILKIQYLHDIESAPSGSKILVVDEIVETGKTMRKMYEKSLLWKGTHDIDYRFACIYMRANAKFEPDYYAGILSDDEWVQFPFETEETSVETPRSWGE